jgi:DnaJ-class molecular chaperone
MLNATYSGQDDLISLSDGRTTLTASFYELSQRLERLGGTLPPPCPECEGQGDIVVEERDLVVCGACKGSRVAQT